MSEIPQQLAVRLNKRFLGELWDRQCRIADEIFGILGHDDLWLCVAEEARKEPEIKTDENVLSR